MDDAQRIHRFEVEQQLSPGGFGRDGGEAGPSDKSERRYHMWVAEFGIRR